MRPALLTRHFTGLQDYQAIWHAMQEFTRERQADTADEIWLLQHEPVFTLGQAGKPEHVLDNNAWLEQSGIALVKSDRGGQITYHGPGQLIAYLLIDLKRRQSGVRELVTLMEQSVIDLLQEYGINAYAKKSAPGVYVKRSIADRDIEHKIASVGLRVRRGCSYHGLALNCAMDLTPFHHINPCGYSGLAVTQLSELLPQPPHEDMLANQLLVQLQKHLDKRVQG